MGLLSHIPHLDPLDLDSLVSAKLDLGYDILGYRLGLVCGPLGLVGPSWLVAPLTSPGLNLRALLG